MKNLCTRQEGKNGKVYWPRIGIMFTGKNGNDYIKLNMFPDLLISVFPIDKKESAPSQEPDPSKGVDLS